MQLILSGNPNLDTIRSVVYLANKHYENQINSVLFIDNKGTLFSQKDEPLESKRNDFVRHYINHVSIESVVIEREDLHQRVPQLLSSKLSTYGPSKIIVDLTNGDKFISSTLYASASLSKVEHLFFLILDRSKREYPPESLANEDYKIDVVSPLENLDAIGKYTYFDIIYYRNKADTAISKIESQELKIRLPTSLLRTQIDTGITNYFLEKYPNSISDVGQLIEILCLEIPVCIKNKAKGKIKTKIPNSFDESVTWLRTHFCDPLRGKRNNDLDIYEQELRDLQTIDKLLDLIKVYRNIASHPYDYLRDKEEAKLVINVSLYILEILANSSVFKP